MKLNKQLAVWLTACVVSVLVFRDAFLCWFLMDDFAWLGLKQEIDALQAAGGNGWKLLFEPRAQGTTRVFSERLYFWILHSLFGMDPLPFRLTAFAVQFANLWLIVRISLRLTTSFTAALGSAGFFAIAAFATRPLAWAAAFNQVLAAWVMLAAFQYYLDWLENRDPRKWWLQFALFVLSFGVQESVIVYPAAATLWTWLQARDRMKGTLALWIPSVLFAALHLFGIDHPPTANYTATFDAGLLKNLWSYTTLALGPWLAVLLLGAVAWRAWKHKDSSAAFFCVWFVVFLSPVLPFQNRIADYYLFLPSTGLALAIGCLMRDRISAIVGGLALAVFAAVNVPHAQAELDWHVSRSERIRRVFDAGASLVQARRADTLLLSGVDTELFQTALQDSPFRLVGLKKVFLVPGSETSIRARADLGGVSAYKISLPQAIEALESGKAVVLSITAGEVFDATTRYRNVAMSQYLQSRPRSVNVGEPGYESLLGPGWWPAEDKFRWMAKSASVTLGSPNDPKDRLHVSGFCPESVLKGGPLTLTVKANGLAIGVQTLAEPAPFSVAYRLPKMEAETVRIDLEVNRTTRLPGDARDLGLIFGTFAIRP